MKKSNFLRSSKEMLTKSFNSAKCKTSLKLASSRLKLLRNKKEVQVKQMKRELAQLLDSGQDRTARIRVEHVVREEKMMAAYDLIEIYCELIVARLPIIESQKNCPIDLKEAITSVVFASPRCGDIPELVDVRKHFTAKYGKEFISAAVELRPDCGVSRMLVEKLSAKAPDGQTKIKILGAIAEEHGVKWDAKSVEEAELVPPNDLLNGSGSLQKVDPPQFEDSDARIPLDHSQRHNAFLKSGEQNGRSSLGSQNSVSAHPVSSSGFHDERSEARQSYPGDGNFSVGRQNWNMEFKDATSAAQAAAESAERASLAARAAAELSRVTRQYSSESERSEIQSSGGGGPGMYDTSSIHEHFPKNSSTSSLPDRNPRFQKERVDGLRHDNLARATRQFQDDSHGTSGGGRPGNYGTSSIHEHFPKDLGTSSSPGRNSSFQKERMDDLRHNNLVTAARHCNDSHGTSNRPQSKVSAGGTGSISNNNSYASFEEGDRCMQESLSEEDNRDKMAMRKPSVRTEAELINNFKNDSTEDFNYFGEETTTKDPKLNSSNSCLSTSVVGENTPYSSHQSVGYDATNDPFNGGYQGHVPSESVNKTSHDFASVAFDDSSSEDNDNIKFDSDPVYDGQQAKLYFPSPERKSPTLDAASKHSWSFDSDKSLEKFPLSSEIFVERHSDISSESLLTTGDNSRPQNAVPTFDDSDDMNSGSDSEMVHTSIGRSKDFQDVFYEHSQNYDSPGSSNKGNVSGTDGKKWSHTSDKLLSDDVHKHGKSDSISFSSDDEAKHTKPQDGKDDAGTPIDDGSLDSSGFGFEEEFKFGKLTGGLKHKGHIPPPYTRSQLNNVSSSVERLKGSPVVMSQAVSPRKNSIGLGVRMKTDDKSSSRLEDAHSASDSDSSEEEFSRETSSYRQRTHAQKTGGEVNTKYAGLRGSTTYFDSDSSDSEIGPKKQSLAARSQLGSGFSRRTKASSSSLDTSSSSKYKRSSVAAVASDTGIDKKSTRSTSGADTQEPKKPLVHSYVADTQEQQRLTRNSYSNETHESPSHRRVSSKQPGVGLAASNLSSQPNMVAHEGRLKSGRVEQPAKMGAASGSNDAPRAPASSDNKFSREDSMNKASHVHPKLPDYDDIAAKLQSLRMNNK